MAPIRRWPNVEDDAVKIDPPGGSAIAASGGPFLDDIPDPERRLSLWYYNTSKRGITLNLEIADGRALFERLAGGIESHSGKPSAQASRLSGGSIMSLSANEQAGFTLVEVLVTLVLLSMVGTIVFGGLVQVLDARTRLRPYLDQAEETALVAGWFRQTVQALIPDYNGGKDSFAATESSFSGLTASPLIGAAGTPTGFGWVLRYQAGPDVTILEYIEKPAKPLQIARWSGKAGSFSYFDRENEWRKVWPPPEVNQAAPQLQLPQLVRLGGVPHEALPMIVAAPRASPVPRPQPSLLGAVLPQ